MAKLAHGLSRYDRLVKECLEDNALNTHAEGKVLPQIFGYLRAEGANEITGNLSKKHIVDAFEALVDSMRVTETEPGKADAGMTFLGQFIDHDITHDAQSTIGTKIDPRNIRNIRTPGLDLDSTATDRTPPRISTPGMRIRTASCSWAGKGAPTICRVTPTAAL